MVLPSDYLGPDAKERDLGRLTHELTRATMRGGECIVVEYKTIPPNATGVSSRRPMMEHCSQYQVDLYQRIITIIDPATITINPEIIKGLQWQDFVAAFMHELHHYEMRTGMMKIVQALSMTRVNQERLSIDVKKRLESIAKTATYVEELFANGRGASNMRATNDFRYMQQDSVDTYLQNIDRMVMRDTDLFGYPDLEASALAQSVEEAYTRLTGDDPNTYGLRVVDEKDFFGGSA